MMTQGRCPAQGLPPPPIPGLPAGSCVSGLVSGGLSLPPGLQDKALPLAELEGGGEAMPATTGTPVTPLTPPASFPKRL